MHPLKNSAEAKAREPFGKRIAERAARQRDS
jgi:hypothetical protein